MLSVWTRQEQKRKKNRSEENKGGAQLQSAYLILVSIKKATTVEIFCLFFTYSMVALVNSIPLVFCLDEMKIRKNKMESNENINKNIFI